MEKLDTRAFSDDLKKEKLYIRMGDITKIYSSELRHGFFIDVFSYRIEDNGILGLSAESNKKMWPNEYFYVNEVFPLVQYRFGKTTITGANNPVPYFERLYQKKDHDHLSEIGI